MNLRDLGPSKPYLAIQAWVVILMQILTENYAMNVIKGSLEASFNVLLSEINKIWFLLILGIWVLNNYICTFTLHKQYFTQILT